MKPTLFLLGSLLFYFVSYGQNTLNQSIHLNEKQSFSQRMKFKAVDNHSNYDLVYHRIYWEVDPSKLYIKGAITSYFKTLTNAFSAVYFDMIDPLKTDSVIYHRQKLTFTHSNDLLKINLPSSLNNGTLDSLTVYYQGVPVSASGFGSFETSFHNNSPILWTLSEPYGAKEWWPCKQTLTDKIDSIDIYVKTPIGNKVGSNGKLIYEKTSGNSTTAYWKHRYPIATYLVAIAVTNYVSFSDFATVNEQNDQVEILNYVYPESLEWAQPMAKYTVDALELYSSLFIPYPFYKEKYGHAQFGFPGGMEHQTMSFMVNFSQDLIAHELAHQWFGDYITCSNWHDIWVNEGFAVFCESLCQEHLHPQNYLNWKMSRMEYVLSSTESGSVYVEDTTNIDRIFDYSLTYQKGGLIIHQLRNQIGDEAFFKGINNLLTDPKTQAGFVSANDVKEFLQTAADTNLTTYFNDWYYGEGFPEYTFEWTQDADNSVSIKMSQTTTHNSVSFFAMKIPLLLKGSSTDTLIKFHNTGNQQVFFCNPDFNVTSIVFDPEYTIIAPHPANIISTISNEEIEKTISLIPNPGNDLVTVLTDKNAPIESIVVVDASGKIMLQQKHTISTNKTEINISQIPQGVYFVRIETNKGIATKRLTVSR